MAANRGTSSVASLVTARTAQRVARENSDPVMLAEAKEYESRALAASVCHLNMATNNPTVKHHDNVITYFIQSKGADGIGRSTFTNTQ
jgi:hypothetical protein